MGGQGALAIQALQTVVGSWYQHVSSLRPVEKTVAGLSLLWPWQLVEAVGSRLLREVTVKRHPRAVLAVARGALAEMTAPDAEVTPQALEKTPRKTRDPRDRAPFPPSLPGMRLEQ